MNAIQRSLVAHAAYNSGFEQTRPANGGELIFASVRHTLVACVVTLDDDSLSVRLSGGPVTLVPELRRGFPEYLPSAGSFVVANSTGLSALLERAAGLAMALPNRALQDFEVSVAQELRQLPMAVRGTEVERTVRQRVGQDRYRAAQMDYWSGACAVTGVAVPEVLRASHAKPWAECDTDAERLDVFNGFLLCAQLDALFDAFLVSFGSQGKILLSPRLTELDLRALGVSGALRLRWVAAEHQSYLAWHRQRLVDR